MADPSQILVLRLSSVGDVLLATPVVRALRRQYPAARIRFLVKPEYAELVHLNPHLDGVVTWPVMPRGGGIAAAGPFSGAARRLADELRSAGPGWLVDLQASPRSRAFARVLRAERTFTYPKPYVRRHLLVRAKIDRFADPPRSVAERYFDAVAELGLIPDGEGLELVTGPAADARAAELLPEGGWIAVAPGARWATKRWPPESFAAAARALALEGGAGVAILGSGADRAAATVVEALLAGAGIPIRQLAGGLTLLESAAVLRRAGVLLANDSGATHLSAAVRTPVVTLFGSTVPQFGFAPYCVASRSLGVEGLPCRPCTHVGRTACPLGHFKCMREIPAAAAVHAAREIANPPARA